MKKIQVLMSTYNGEKFIREQLNSILDQSYQSIKVCIRDDGSTDGTINILKEYSEQYSNVKYVLGDNLGTKNSFFQLIQDVDLDADYYAFSDQDDVWKKDKIEHIVNELEQKQLCKIPFLYCGNTTLVDQNLDIIENKIKRKQPVPSFGNSLIENICVGCTMVVNKDLFVLVRQNIPDYTVMHDWWFYMTASCFGEVCYDNDSYVLYRQHSNNSIGMKATHWGQLKRRIADHNKYRGTAIKQAKQFQRIFNVNNSQKYLLKQLIDYRTNLKTRIKLICNERIYRQRKLDNIIFKMLFILGEV